LRTSIERACANSKPAEQQTDHLAFDPFLLRKELRLRQQVRMDRLICLLRATELVQALGQPSGNTTLSGLFNTKVLRPLTKLTPNFIKAPIFDAVLKYSLGLGLFSSISGQKQPLVVQESVAKGGDPSLDATGREKTTKEAASSKEAG